MNIRMIGVALVAVVVWGAEGKLAPPKIEDYTHVCRKCGKTTHCPTSELGPRSFGQFGFPELISYFSPMQSRQKGQEIC